MLDNKMIFGYLLAHNVLFDIATGRLINIRSSLSEYSVPCITMRRTMVLLLKFFLERRNDDTITTDEILYYVWDRNHLQSSTQRLWHVMRSLKDKLKNIGIEDDFIIRKDKQSYKVVGYLIEPIYYN